MENLEAAQGFAAAGKAAYVEIPAAKIRHFWDSLFPALSKNEIADCLAGVDGDNESGIHNHHKAEEVLADGLEPALVGIEEYSEHEADAARKRHIREPRRGDDVLPRRENHCHQHRQRQDGDGLNQRRLAPQLLPVENRVLVIIFHLQSVVSSSLIWNVS